MISFKFYDTRTNNYVNDKILISDSLTPYYIRDLDDEIDNYEQLDELSDLVVIDQSDYSAIEYINIEVYINGLLACTKYCRNDERYEHAS